MLDRTKRAWRWVWPPLVVFIVLVGAGVAGVLFQRSLTNETNIRTLVEQTAQDQRAIDQLGEKLDQANTRLETNGLPPVVVPSTVPSTGARGERGEPGADATAEQIAQAQAEWCLAHANCIGPKGDKGDRGEPGAAGADSTVPGPSGPQGPAGANAPTVISIQCLDDGNGQFTFSDMSIFVVPNMCQSTPIIPELPTPEEGTE